MPQIIWSMDELYKIARGWQESEFDGIIVFDGNRGISKSTGAYKFCCKFDNFKPKHDIAFSREEVIKLVEEKNKGIIFADEMINVTYNREFFSEEQKKLIKMLNMYRDRCNILVACVPNFYDLDKQFRNMVKVRINVIKRGIGIIHTKNQSSYSVDKWDSDLNEKIEKSWFKRNVYKPHYDKLTTYRGYITYGKLGPAQEQLYKSIKEEKRNRLVQDEMLAKNKKNQWDELYDKYKVGKVDRDSIQVWCNIQDIKITNALSNLSMRARAEGTTLREIDSKNKLLNIINPPVIVKKDDGNVRLKVI